MIFPFSISLIINKSLVDVIRQEISHVLIEIPSACYFKQLECLSKHKRLASLKPKRVVAGKTLYLTLIAALCLNNRLFII